MAEKPWPAARVTWRHGTTSFGHDVPVESSYQNALGAIDRGTRALRSRLHLPAAEAVIVEADHSWLDAIRVAIARAQAGPTVERLEAADVLLAEFFAARSVTPVWTSAADE